jgi:hypothetical protein
MDKDKALPDICGYGRETELALLEIMKIIFVRYSCELSLGVIRPAMKMAGERPATGARLFPDELVRAMRADVVKPTHDAVRPPNHQNRSFAYGKVTHEIVAWVGNSVDAADVEPGAAKNPLAFEFKIFRGNARFLRDRSRPQLWILFRPAFVFRDSFHGIPSLCDAKSPISRRKVARMASL